VEGGWDWGVYITGSENFVSTVSFPVLFVTGSLMCGFLDTRHMSGILEKGHDRQFFCGGSLGGRLTTRYDSELGTLD
jgi:hypothetical protein